MKTKKEILKWWEDLGKIEVIDDLKDFTSKIDKSISIIKIKEAREEDLVTGKVTKIDSIRLICNKWKRGLYLDFIDNECIRITGF